MISPVAAAEAALAADRAHGDAAIWISRVPAGVVMARARALEREGPRGRALWGVPFAVKDNIDVAGMPTTAACPGFEHEAAASAPAVQLLLDAGAVLIGKTNLDQFAAGLVGVRSPYGVPRNVFDAARVPGGSSSGSAVAVAAGIVPFALGTDTAGSGRVPAMFGQVVGVKPTIGTVSTRGVVPACRSIDTISVFSGSVDAGLEVLRVIAGYDAEDRYARPAPFAHLRRGALAGSAVVGVAEVDDLCDPGVAAGYRAAAGMFSTRAVDLAPFLRMARLLYDGPWVAERSAALRALMERHPEMLHEVTRRVLLDGMARRAVDAFDAFHELAAVRRLAQVLFAECDALMLPTAPFTPTLAEVRDDPFGANSRLGTFTNFVNLCDMAAIAVPCGRDPLGVPVGVTLLGPAFSEGRLAALADAVQRRFCATVGATGSALPAPGAVDPVGPGETALFCLGAHMTGLALNGQVTALGGRLLRTDRTAAGYRLHALGARPGLLRGDGAGCENEAGRILGEVWALPTAAIGALLAQVPAPLGFGTVALESGPCLGFLAEAAGVAGAEDVTAYGGWRAWLAR